MPIRRTRRSATLIPGKDAHLHRKLWERRATNNGRNKEVVKRKRVGEQSDNGRREPGALTATVMIAFAHPPSLIRRGHGCATVLRYNVWASP